MSYNKPQLVKLNSASKALQGQDKDFKPKGESSHVGTFCVNAYEADE